MVDPQTSSRTGKTVIVDSWGGFPDSYLGKLDDVGGVNRGWLCTVNTRTLDRVNRKVSVVFVVTSTNLWSSNRTVTTEGTVVGTVRVTDPRVPGWMVG